MNSIDVVLLICYFLLNVIITRAILSSAFSQTRLPAYGISFGITIVSFIIFIGMTYVSPINKEDFDAEDKMQTAGTAGADAAADTAGTDAKADADTADDALVTQLSQTRDESQQLLDNEYNDEYMILPKDQWYLQQGGTNNCMCPAELNYTGLNYSTYGPAITTNTTTTAQIKKQQANPIMSAAGAISTAATEAATAAASADTDMENPSGVTVESESTETFCCS